MDIYEDLPVGIDLGTTNSCIGYWDGKEVKIVPNRMGEKTTPSTIYLYKDDFIIGEEIQKDLNLLNNSEKIYSLKRIIGKDYNDKGFEDLIKNLHYNIIKGENNKPYIKLIINGKEELFTPEKLCSEILIKLVNDAKKIVGRKIEKVVISVPAYFDDAQRSAKIEAAKLAKLDVIRLINEPTAAALSYGLGQKLCPIKKEKSFFSDIFKNNRNIRKSNNINYFDISKFNNINKNSFCLNNDDENNINKINDIEINKNEISSSLISVDKEKGKNILVFDLGGGTYDLVILTLNLDKKEYTVFSKYSNNELGGDNFDEKIAKYCIKYCKFDNFKDKIDKKSLERLKKASEYAKKYLSKQKFEDNDNFEDQDIEDEDEDKDQDIEITIRIDNFVEGMDLIAPISRKLFENIICKDLFDKLNHFDELLKKEEKELTRNDIDEIILVGGSTRMPKIKKILKKEFKNIKINDQINPEEVVAYGATIQAAMILNIENKENYNNPIKNVKLLDITPLTLGTDVANNSNEPKIKELGNKMDKIIDKWTQIPTTKVKEYRTKEDYQESMQICIYEGENEYTKYNKLLDIITLVNLPKRPKGKVICKVKFSIDKNNILTVEAYEESEGKSREIKTISKNRNEKINYKSNNIKLHEFDKLKKEYKTNVKNLLKIYQKSSNNIDKIKALEKYNICIKENINKINPDENPDNINIGNIEKYFFYVYQLLESLEEILYLNENKKKEELILEEIKKYINIFKKQSTYYIKEIIELFKGAKREVFLNIFYYSIKSFNESGLYYLNNLQKMSRYYSKLYFEEVIQLYKKYIIMEDQLLTSDIKDKIDYEKANSENNLENITSNSIILLLKFSNNRKILFNPSHSIEEINRMRNITNKWGETGFTYLDKIINPDGRDFNYEDYNLILDELNKIINKINADLNLVIIEDDDRQNELLEEKGICLGNIAKVKFIYQNGKEYEKYKKLIDDSIECAKFCKKDNDNCDWYKEVLSLLEKIKRIEEQEINKEIKNDLEKINNYFNSDKQNFIDYILEIYPYDGYDKNNRSNQYNWDNIERDLNLLEFLIEKYKPNYYQNNTKEEKKRYKVIVNISDKLKKIYADIIE